MYKYCYLNLGAIYAKGLWVGTTTLFVYKYTNLDYRDSIDATSALIVYSYSNIMVGKLPLNFGMARCFSFNVKLEIIDVKLVEK